MEFSNNIPRLMHFLKFGDECYWDEYKIYYSRATELHKEWDIRIHNLSDSRRLILTYLPQYLKAFDSYPLDIQRADFARIAFIYLFGGFYLDLDMFCLKSIDELRFNSLILGVEKILTLEECYKLKLTDPVRIANYMFGSTPMHPFWRIVLDALNEASEQPVLIEDDVINSTGPGLLTSIYHKSKSKFDDIILLANANRKCLKSCDAVSCHFGDYAAHLHLGKWRWG